MPFYECFTCRKVLFTDKADKCPSCGGTNGQEIPDELVSKGMEAGTYFNIDPTTGGRAKKKKKAH